MAEVYESIVVAPIEGFTDIIANAVGFENTPMFRGAVLGGAGVAAMFFLQPRFAFDQRGRARPWKLLDDTGKGGAEPTLVPWYAIPVALGAFGAFFV